MEWIDLALLGDEASLASTIAALEGTDLRGALDSVASALGLRTVDVERAALRIFVERVRPFALPASLWSRPITASDDAGAHVREYFERRGIDPTPERARLALDLYARFVDERLRTPVGEAELERCGYRCEHCGLTFCNEELQPKGLVSRFGTRSTGKVDHLKPHWNGADALSWRQPTMDHHWPVSLYGNNDRANLRVICRACNDGKADFLALEQTPPWVELPGRKQLLGGGPLSRLVFYAQLRAAPRCATSGLGPGEVELTVTLRDPTLPAVLDNLVRSCPKGWCSFRGEPPRSPARAGTVRLPGSAG